jgi:hypothetical protein
MTEELYLTIPMREFERLKRAENAHHIYLGLRAGQVCPLCGVIVDPLNAPPHEVPSDAPNA